MPEGPSLVILREKLQPFTGKTVSHATGYAAMDKKWLLHKKLLEVNTWGKHLLLRFSAGTVRIHLMLFGSVLINKRKKVNPSLQLQLGKDELNFYVVQVKKITQPLAKVYDWRVDIMSPHWSAAHVKKLLKAQPGAYIGDLLLNQDIFAGVGNIIRNEALFRARVHPLSVTSAMPATVISRLLKELRSYSRLFLEQKKQGTLSANWQAYKKDECPRDGSRLQVALTGKTRRKTYYCPVCQERYS